MKIEKREGRKKRKTRSDEPRKSLGGTKDNVTQIHGLGTERCEETSELVATLNQKIDDNKLIGLATVAFCRGGEHVIGLTGIARENPSLTIAVLTRMIHSIIRDIDDEM